MISISVWFCFVDLECTFTEFYNAKQCKTGGDNNNIAVVYITNRAQKPSIYGYCNASVIGTLSSARYIFSRNTSRAGKQEE